MSLRQFELAFEDAARELDFKGGPDENGCATISSSVPGMPDIHLAYIPEDDGLVLLAEIGFVPEDDQGIYREFLELAYLGNGSRGAGFAVDPVNGKVVLQREVNVGSLDGNLLVVILSDFAEVAFKSRRRLFHQPEEVEDPQQDGNGEMITV